MSNPAYDYVRGLAEHRAQAAIEVIVETSPNNYADPHDFFYQLHHFPSEQKYEAWLTEHFDADAIDTDALDGLPRPQLLHEGAMGEEQVVEVLVPEKMPTDQRAASFVAPQQFEDLSELAQEVRYSRPELTIAQVSDPKGGWGSHDRLYVYDEENPNYQLVVEAWRPPGRDPDFEVTAVDAGSGQQFHNASQLRLTEAKEQALELAETMPKQGELAAEESLKHRQALMAHMSPEQIMGNQQNAGPGLS